MRHNDVNNMTPHLVLYLSLIYMFPKYRKQSIDWFLYGCYIGLQKVTYINGIIILSTESYAIWGHSSSKYAKLSKKLIFR